MIRLILTLLGSSIGLYAAYSYLRSIVKGNTRPHRVTWGGWFLASVLGLISSLEGGAGIGLIVTATFVVPVAITFGLSLYPKYGKPGGSKLDYVAGAVAAAALLTRLFVDYSPDLSATIAVVADVVFLWPTLRESWRQPKTEALWPWIGGTVAEAFGIAALGNYSYAASAYSIYILIADLAVVGVLVIRYNRPKPQKLKNIR